MKSHAADGIVERTWKRFPDACATYAVFEGVVSYSANNLWTAVTDALGIEEGQANEWGEQFVAYLDRHGLSNPAMDGMSQVAPILLHGLVPNACLVDLFDLVAHVAAKEALTTSAADELLTIVRNHPDRSSFPEPVKRFLAYGGDSATRVIKRTIEWTKNPRSANALSASDARVPTRFADAFRAWRGGEDYGPVAEGSSRFTRPHLYFDRSSTCVRMWVPGQQFESGAATYRWILRDGATSWSFSPPHSKTYGTLDPIAVDLPVRAERYVVELQRDGEHVREWPVEGIATSRRWLAFEIGSGRRLADEAIPASGFLLVLWGDAGQVSPREAFRTELGTLDPPLAEWCAVEIAPSERSSIEVGGQPVRLGVAPFGLSVEEPVPFAHEARVDPYSPLFVGRTPKLRVDGAEALSADARVHIRSLGMTHPRGVDKLRRLRDLGVAWRDGLLDLSHGSLLGARARGRFRVDVRDGPVNHATLEPRIAPEFRLLPLASGYEVETRDAVSVNGLSGTPIAGKEGWWTFTLNGEPESQPQARFREETPQGFVELSMCFERRGLHVAFDAIGWDRVVADGTTIPVSMPTNRVRAASSRARIEGDFGEARSIELQLRSEDGARCAQLEVPRRFERDRERGIAIFDLTAFTSSVDAASPGGILRATWELGREHASHDVVRLGPPQALRIQRGSVRRNAPQTQIEVTWECERGVSEFRIEVFRLPVENSPPVRVLDEIWPDAAATGHVEATLGVASLPEGRYLARVVPIDVWSEAVAERAPISANDPDVFAFEIDADARMPEHDAGNPLVTLDQMSYGSSDVVHQHDTKAPSGESVSTGRFAAQSPLDALDHALEEWDLFSTERIDHDRIDLASIGLLSREGPKRLDEYRRWTTNAKRETLSKYWPGVSAVLECTGLAQCDSSAWRRISHVLDPLHPERHLSLPIGLRVREREGGRRKWKILHSTMAESGVGLELIVEDPSNNDFAIRYVGLDGAGLDERESLAFDDAIPRDVFLGKPPQPGELAPSRRLFVTRERGRACEQLYAKCLTSWMTRTATSTPSERELEAAARRLKKYLATMKKDHDACNGALLDAIHRALEIPDEVTGRMVATNVEGRTVPADVAGRRVPHVCAMLALACRIRARRRERQQSIGESDLAQGDLARLAGLAMNVAPDLFGWYLARFELLLVLRDHHRSVK
ncbi:MAG: hypothetical protein IT459_22990 [Planctomycetes bacterium]|nr:hypothetical protein [Planctomycetota bacterium]